ncbi:TerD family protein [Flammeovirga sp. SJP92]|uniref:TerD family protein n=1 Tax=Flammeovirga sp. SJP92 TaxID=1775430 RepID=UPI000788FA5A|nr:TerD family protein [Flammeovirga sp. SJP92]KXX69483.1 hypothetical protein AVL50_15530 [Flammeovirga sp. SJP92]
MSNIELQKKSKITLTKGSTISLTKDNGNSLDFVRVGVNWGAIQKKVFFNMIPVTSNVDLDASLSAFDNNMEHVYTVFYNKLTSPDSAIKHYGDDLEGDLNGNDGLDNEIIWVDLKNIDKKVKQIYLYLNSYSQQNFSQIPFSEVNIYSQNECLANFNLSASEEYADYVSMLMGRLVLKNGCWEFEVIGTPIAAKDISETISYIKENY